MLKWLIAVSFLLGLADGAFAQILPCVMPREDLVSPQVQATAAQSAARFDYRYALTNKAEAQQTLVSFAVEALSTPPPVQASPPAWTSGFTTSSRGNTHGT